jgi:hypothetical protein
MYVCICYQGTLLYWLIGFFADFLSSLTHVLTVCNIRAPQPDLGMSWLLSIIPYCPNNIEHAGLNRALLSVPIVFESKIYQRMRRSILLTNSEHSCCDTEWDCTEGSDSRSGWGRRTWADATHKVQKRGFLRWVWFAISIRIIFLLRQLPSATLLVRYSRSRVFFSWLINGGRILKENMEAEKVPF